MGSLLQFGAGVIDPTKVTRTALQNAASIAAHLLVALELHLVERRNAAQQRYAAARGRDLLEDRQQVLEELLEDYLLSAKMRV